MMRAPGSAPIRLHRRQELSDVKPPRKNDHAVAENPMTGWSARRSLLSRTRVASADKLTSTQLPVAFE